MTGGLLAVIFLALLVLIIIAKTAVVVPQQSAYVVERLGRFHGILNAGFHVLLPFVDVIRYRHSLKEIAIDIPAQVCITRDNVQVGVDGVLYLKVLNPERASYGISDYLFAISQLAQTTLRSEVGKIDLDRTFEERTNINTAVVSELDKASEAWGVKVLRYEIKNITPPADILAAMEKQMRAEREKRAVILTSEGTRDAAINTAEGMKQETIKHSEARKLQQINEAEGEAAAIMSVATATAAGIRSVAEAIKLPGGYEAVQLRVAEQYITQFGELAKTRQHDRAAGERRRRRLDDGAGHEDDRQGIQSLSRKPSADHESRRPTRRDSRSGLRPCVLARDKPARIRKARQGEAGGVATGTASPQHLGRGRSRRVLEVRRRQEIQRRGPRVIPYKGIELVQAARRSRAGNRRGVARRCRLTGSDARGVAGRGGASLCRRSRQDAQGQQGQQLRTHLRHRGARPVSRRADSTAETTEPHLDAAHPCGQPDRPAGSRPCQSRD